MGVEKVIVAKLLLDGKDFKKNAGDVTKSVTKLTASVTAAVAGVAAAAKATAEYQDEIIKAARATGSTAEEFSVFNRAAQLAGVSADTLQGGLKKLTKPSDQAKKAMKELGVTLTDANGNMKSQFDLLSDLADGFKKVESPQKRTALAFTLFEEAGTRMINVLKDGSEGLDKVAKDTERLGLIVTETAGVAAEKFNDDLADMTASLAGVRNAVSESVIAFVNQNDIITSITDQVTEITAGWKSLGQGTQETIITTVAFSGAIAGVVLGLTALAQIIPVVSAALASTTGVIGLVVAGFAGLLIAFDAFSESSEELTMRTRRQVKDLNEASAVIGELGKRTNLTEQETAKLATANAALKKAADELNVSLVDQSGALVDIEEQERRVRAAKIDQVKADITALKVSAQRFDDLTAKRAKRIVDILKNRVTIEEVLAGKVKFRNEQEKFAAGGQIRSLRAFTALSERRSAAAKDLEKDLQKLLKPTKALGASVSNTNKDLGNQENKFKALRVQIDPFNKAILDLRNSFTNNEKEFKRLMDNLKTQYDLEKREIERNRIQAQIDVANAQQTRRKLDSIAEGLVQVSAKAQVVIGAFKMLSDNAARDIEYTAQVLDRDLEVQALRAAQASETLLKTTEETENARIEALRDSYDSQIADLKSVEAQKLMIIQNAANERLLALDEEFAAAKAKREAEFQAYVESETARFEFDKENILQKAIDEEERRISEAVLDEDFKQYIEGLNEEHEENLSTLAADFANKRRASDDKAKADEKQATESLAAQILRIQNERDAALVKAQADKDAKLQAIERAGNAEQKRLAKERAQAQYDAQVAAFEATKNTKKAETLASGIASAAQAFAALAPIPFVGPILGAAAAAVITKATFDYVGQIEKQKPIKPAELSMDRGGVLSGPSHAQGGIKAELEGDETVIDRRRTEMLFRAIERNELGGGRRIEIVFGERSIVTEQPIDSPDVVRRMAMMLGEAMESEGVLSV